MASVINNVYREHTLFIDEFSELGFREVQVSGPCLTGDWQDTDDNDIIVLQSVQYAIDRAIAKAGKDEDYPRPEPRWQK